MPKPHEVKEKEKEENNRHETAEKKKDRKAKELNKLKREIAHIKEQLANEEFAGITRELMELQESLNNVEEELHGFEGRLHNDLVKQNKKIEGLARTKEQQVVVLDKIAAELKKQNKVQNEVVEASWLKKTFATRTGWALVIAGLGTVFAATSGTIIAIYSALSYKKKEDTNIIIEEKEKVEEEPATTEEEKRAKEEKIRLLNEKIKEKRGELVNQNDAEVWSNVSQTIKEEEIPLYDQIHLVNTLQLFSHPSNAIWKDEAKEKSGLAQELVDIYNQNKEMPWSDIYKHGYETLKHEGKSIQRQDLAEIFQLATAQHIAELESKTEVPQELAGV
ncbi:MAG: hypothetical protein ACSNEK_09170 [Parachlamydiaceae bacterium]